MFSDSTELKVYFIIGVYYALYKILEQTYMYMYVWKVLVYTSIPYTEWAYSVGEYQYLNLSSSLSRPLSLSIFSEIMFVYITL